MPITFGCECGKQFTVKDEFAGKRTKCPACASALIVPTPSAEPASAKVGSDEDEAYRMLMAGSEPEPAPAPAPVRRDPPPDDYTPRRPSPAPVPASPPTPKRGPRFETYSADEAAQRRRGPAVHVTPAVAGGCLSMVIAVVWFGLGMAAGIIYFYPPILFLFGLVAVVRGLLGYSED